MKEIVSILVIIMLLCTSFVLIVDNDFNVEGSSGGEGENYEINLPYDYAWFNTTSNLSYVVHNDSIWGSGDEVIRMGRTFGTPGDNWTAYYINTSLNELGLENVTMLQLETIGPDNYEGEIPWKYENKPWRCNYKIETVDYNLTFNHPGWEEEWSSDGHVPKNESFVMPSAWVCLNFSNPDYNKLTYNNSFKNSEIEHKNIGEKILMEGATSDNYFNVSIDNVTNIDILYGNVTYLTIGETLPDDQDYRLFIFDEEQNCEDQLANVTNATGVILIHNNTKGYTANTSSYQNISIGRCNIADNNVTDVIDMLENGTAIFAENTNNSEILTFYHNFSYLTWWPKDQNNGLFIIHEFSEWDIIWLLHGVFGALNWFFQEHTENGFLHGFIIYDNYNDVHIMERTSRDWRGWDYSSNLNISYDISKNTPPLQTFLINKTIGEFLMENIEDEQNTVSGYLEQEEKNVEAFNVLGNITIDKSPDDAIIILEGRPDAQWGECPGDSGAGVGIIMGIAKYIKDNEIKPKYNLTFLFTTGEEYGMRGSWYHSLTHPNDNIIYWIGTDQLGFNFEGTGQVTILSNNSTSGDRGIVWAIANETQLVEKSGYSFDTVLATDPQKTNEAAFRWRGEIFGKSCSTICIHKKGWEFHHRAGENYTEGDSMKYIDRDDLNATLNFSWGIIKYYCFNPDAWFTNVSYQVFDSPNDGDALNDSIRANFTLNTIMPNDKLRVELLYDIQGGSSDNLYSLQNYNVNSSGLNASVVFSIPDDMDKGDYSIKLVLYNSTGIINMTVGLGDDYINDTGDESNVSTLYHPFGYTNIGDNFETIDDRITGSNFTVNENGYADNITAYINQVYMSPGPYQCIIYRANDSKFVANTTENWTPRDHIEPPPMLGWAVFNFSEPKPSLTKDTEYVITCWGENVYSRLYYDNFSYTLGRYDNETYGDPPDNANFINESRLYSIYCSYTPLGPEINSVSANPETVGFGFNITISANVTDNATGVNFVKVNIIYPDMSSENYTMSAITNISAYNYQYIFNDTWQHGMYNYTIWAFGNSGGRNSSSGHSFNVSANATISVCTLKDNYTINEFVNITDPPNPLDDYYIIERGLTWDKYYNAETGANTLVVSQGPINYQNETDDWIPINCSLNTLENNHIAYNYGYRFGNEQGLYNVYFKSNSQDVWPVVFAYNKSNNPENHIVRSKLIGVGYLDPSNDWSFEFLQNIQSSQGQIVNNSITFENVFTGTDVVWSYGNNGLKEEIIMSNTTKNLLQCHPPSDYGLSNHGSYLVFITKLDYSGLNMYNTTGMLNGNFTVVDGVIDFKDALGYFKCAMPLGEAYELYNNSVCNSLVYRVLQYNNNFYLLSSLKLVDLNNMSFPVVIDPTLTIESLNTDGYVYNSSSDYNTVWNASTGTVSSSATYISIGQKKTSGFPSNYYIYRGFLIFNTTELPDNAYIDNATVSLYKKDDYSIKDFFLTVQNGQPGYPHNPLETGDYNKDNYRGCGGGFNTTSFTNGRNNITLTNYSWLTKEGITKFCLRSSCDIEGTAPSKDEYINVYSSDAPGMDYYPKLIINYRNQSKIKNTGLTDIKGFLLMQVHFYNEQQIPPGWIVANDTINETTARTINAMDQFGLDTVFNDIVNTSGLLSLYGRGLYRVYAAFCDSNGDVLVCDDDSLLEASYEFTIS